MEWIGMNFFYIGFVIALSFRLRRVFRSFSANKLLSAPNITGG